LAGTKSPTSAFRTGAKIKAGNIVLGRQYFLRQAATLLEFAHSTNDPELAATLIEKASNFLAQIDEPSARPDPSLQAPDAVLNNAIAIYLDFMVSSSVNRNNTGCSALVPLVGKGCARCGWMTTSRRRMASEQPQEQFGLGSS
jgi:hypothetical protein